MLAFTEVCNYLEGYILFPIILMNGLTLTLTRFSDHGCPVGIEIQFPIILDHS